MNQLEVTTAMIVSELRAGRTFNKIISSEFIKKALITM
jgi:hypothetical protein